MPEKKAAPAVAEDFSLEEFPFYWLAHAHAIYVLEMEKVLKKIGTDMPTRRVLLMLKLRGTASISDLSRHTIIKMSTLTRIVQRMRDEGLVETRTNPDDARVTDVLITPRGEELAARIEQSTRKVFARGYDGMPVEEMKALMQSLQKIFRNFADY
ncbi:MAG: winged helix-turn-helix transcriptional regulator [Proteobacteria bacterium]|nr:winged helix-turn-helix transcriptional regulator [Pseudomonadota bacterium]